MPLILQSNRGECALACVAMIANYHGLGKTMGQLRRAHPYFGRGASLRDLVECAKQLNLTPRPLKAGIEMLHQISLPGILHFDFDHFVVLFENKKGAVVIADPASGMKELSIEELGQRYTGVAVELRPSPLFKNQGDDSTAEKAQFLSVAAHWKPIARYVGLNATVLGLSLLAPLSIQVLVDKVIPNQDHYLLSILVIAFLLVNLLLVIGRRTSTLFNMKQGLSLKYFQTAHYLETLLRNPLSYFADKPLGNFVAQYNSIHFLVNHIVHDVGSAITDMLFIAVLILILLLINPSIAIIIVVTSTAVVGLRWLIVKNARMLQNQVIVAESQDEAYFVETLRGMYSIKANRLEQVRQLGGVDKIVNTVKASHASAVFQMRYETAVSIVKACESAVLVFLLVNSVLSGSLTIGAMYTFYMYAKFLEDRLSNYVSTISNILNIKVHQQRLSEPFEVEQPSEDKNPTIAPHLKLQGNICVENITYRLNTNLRLFDGLTIEILKGQFMLVAGASGAGKSTLLKIILGIMQPDTGRITIDGSVLASIPDSMLKNNIGVVLQEDTLFSGSIAENVAMFDEFIDLERVQECCRLCMVDEDIRSMPMNYLTPIGDMGAGISSGQRQRLLLARALYKRPSILILDEATANLDMKTEQLVLASLKSLKKTIVFASHSQTVAAYCDTRIELGKHG
jgi:ATP-binding cassette, subfamily B, bacterial CvaB/MchF/RaxB